MKFQGNRFPSSLPHRAPRHNGGSVRLDCSDLEILLIDFEPKLVKLLSEVGFACHRYLTRSPSSEGVVRSDFDRILMWIHSFEQCVQFTKISRGFSNFGLI